MFRWTSLLVYFVGFLGRMAKEGISKETHFISGLTNESNPAVQTAAGRAAESYRKGESVA